MLDTTYTNGVIAVKEKSLLGEKLLRFAEMNAEEAFRALTESGFGSGSEAKSAADAEALCRAEEASLDGFIRAYAPSQAIAEYLLAPRDFHNLKALAKAKRLGTDAADMLAPQGLLSVAELEKLLESGACPELAENATGAEIGAAFDRALYARLFEKCKRSPLLKELLAGKADRLNILTALRSSDEEFAKSCYVAGGKLKEERLHAVFLREEKALERTPYREFYRLARTAREEGRPFTEAERAQDSWEAEYFAARKYTLGGKEPFLYYVFRRRAEIANVRILLVCLNAGLGEQEIKKRLRAI